MTSTNASKTHLDYQHSVARTPSLSTLDAVIVLISGRLVEKQTSLQVKACLEPSTLKNKPESKIGKKTVFKVYSINATERISLYIELTKDYALLKISLIL
jgi:hypothetical protein